MVRVSVLVSKAQNAASYEYPIHATLFFLVQNDALNAIVNAERKGKRQVLVRPASRVILRFLSVMQKHGE